MNPLHISSQLQTVLAEHLASFSRRHTYGYFFSKELARCSREIQLSLSKGDM